MKRTAKALAKVTRLQQKMKKVTGGMEHTLHSNECIGAYVVFNEEDSMFRCLDDYHHFSGVYVCQAVHPARARDDMPHTRCVCVTILSNTDLVWCLSPSAALCACLGRCGSAASTA